MMVMMFASKAIGLLCRMVDWHAIHILLASHKWHEWCYGCIFCVLKHLSHSMLNGLLHGSSCLDTLALEGVFNSSLVGNSFWAGSKTLPNHLAYLWLSVSLACWAILAMTEHCRAGIKCLNWQLNKWQSSGKVQIQTSSSHWLFFRFDSSVYMFWCLCSMPFAQSTSES